MIKQQCSFLLFFLFLTLNGWAQDKSVQQELPALLARVNDSLQIQIKGQVSWDSCLQQLSVERSSDGIDFQLLASVSTPDSLPCPAHQYALVDELPVSGYNYYRLRYQLADTTYYSEIAPVFLDDLDINIQVYPDSIQVGQPLHLDAPDHRPRSFELLDTEGGSVVCQQWSGFTRVNTSTMKSGHYHFRIADEYGNATWGWIRVR